MFVHGVGGARGRVRDLSAGGVRFSVNRRAPRRRFRVRPGARLTLDLRLDGAARTWLRFEGVVVREDRRSTVVAFSGVPLDFEDAVQAEHVSALECRARSHVLVVDPVAARRRMVATGLRAVGCHVTDVATPLDAISHLGESRAHPRVIVIGETAPRSTADGLQSFVGAEYPTLRVVRLAARAR